MEAKEERFYTGGSLRIKTVHCFLFPKFLIGELFTVYCLLFTAFTPTILYATNNPPTHLLVKGGFAETAEDIVTKVQEKYETTGDLEATFIQESLIKAMDKIERSEGKVYLKKPGKMRWDYKKPKRQEIVIDSGIIWIYQPEQKQVLKSTFSDSESSSGPYNRTPASFLYGVGKLKEDFEIKLSKGSNNYIMGLIPKGIKGNIEKIFLEVDPKDYIIQGFSFFDIYGNKTTITLKDIKVNKGLKDSIFHFKVPKEVKVIE